jgi:hypothetical protein
VRPTFSAQDAHLAALVATLDGVSFTSGDVVSDGAHTLSLQATDTAGNVAAVVAHFFVDASPPAITLAGVDEGATASPPVTLSFQVTDASPVQATATLDGAAFAPGGSVSAMGHHTWVVSATDALGHQTTVTRHFDVSAPAATIAISGVTDGQHTRGPVTPVLSFTGAVSTTATLNGQPFVSGTVVSDEGTYALVVSATDATGRTNSSTVSFVIDTTPPVITVTGVTSGLSSRTALTPIFTATGASQLVATLNGVAFISSAPVTGEGSYTLVVTASDEAGNTASSTVPFRIDMTPPVLSLTGVTDGALLRGPVTLAFTVADDSAVTTSATLDGAASPSDSVVSAEGTHTWRVSATDAAGNQASETRSFTLDVTAPRITVSGVTPGESTTSAVTPTFSSSDAHPGTTAATLNGAPWLSGTTLSQPGTYQLVVTATDAAGNTAKQTVGFNLFAPTGNDCRQLTMTAVKRFTPTAGTFDATVGRVTSLRFNLPSSLRVTEGSAGGTDATLTWSLKGVGGTCTYRGGTTAYGFVSCTTGQHAGAAVTADTVTLHLVDASHARPRTAASFELDEVAPCHGDKVVPAFHYAACAFTEVDVKGSATVVGSIASHVEANLSDSARVEGDVVSGGPTLVSPQAQVRGTVYHGGALIPGRPGRACVSRDVKLAVPPQPCECGYDVAGRLADLRKANNNNLLQSDASLSRFLVAGGLVISQGRVAIPGGRYSLAFLRIDPGAALVSTGSQPLQLFVDGDVELNGPLTSQSGLPALVVSAADTAKGGFVSLRATSASVQVYAPEADVALGRDTEVEGAIVAHSIKVTGNAELELAPGHQASPPPLSCP